MHRSLDDNCFKRAFNTPLMHEDQDYICPYTCNFKGKKLLVKINIGVRFTNSMINQIRTRCIEEPSMELMGKFTQDQDLFDQIEHYDAFMDDSLVQGAIEKKSKLKCIDATLGKYPEIQEMKKNMAFKTHPRPQI